MMLHIPTRRIPALALTAALVVLTLPGLAAAHAELKSATPPDKSTQTEPVTEVSGTYSEAMTPDGSSLIVKASSGAIVARGTVDPDNDKRMVATPATPLGNGKYRVESTAVATDGHVEHAVWNFTVAVVATPAPTPSPSPTPTSTATASASAPPTAAPSAAPSIPVPSNAPTAAPSGTGDPAASTGDVILPILVALIILGAGAFYLLSRRNRPPDAT